MDKIDIIKAFFYSGHLLSRDAVEYLSELDDTEINRLSKIVFDDIVLTPELLKKYVAEVRELKVIRKISHEMDVDDFVKFYQTKYEKIKNLIVEKHGSDFISISNLSSKGRTVKIIGMVKDVKKGERERIEIEDSTGKTTIISEKPTGLKIDDVVGFRVREGNSAVFLESVLYPDIPIREPSTGNGKVIFVSDLRLDEAPKEFIDKLQGMLENSGMPVVCVGKYGDESLIKEVARRTKVILSPGGEYPMVPPEIEGVKTVSNPAVIEMNGLKILMTDRFDMDMLKKRYLGTKTLKTDVDMVLDVVPDIVVFPGNKPFVKNYKSTTILCPGSLMEEFSPFVVDFETRSVEKIRWNENENATA